jgi:hypothetical protein
VAAAGLLAAACGSSPSPTGSGGAPGAGGPAGSTATVAQQALAFSRCIRAHGVPNFPEPNGSGRIPEVPPQQLGVSVARFDAAVNACQGLSGKLPAALTAQQQQDYLSAAACMRSHGITSFPDPTFPGGQLTLNLPASIDTSSQQFSRARQACARLIPAGLPHSVPGG